jgi:hypothetical protein
MTDRMTDLFALHLSYLARRHTIQLYPQYNCSKGKVVITRIVLQEAAQTLSVALTGSKSSASAAFTACVRSLVGNLVVASTTVSDGGLPVTGWLTMQPSTGAFFPAGVYDVAIRTTSAALHADGSRFDEHNLATKHTTKYATKYAPVGWLSDSAPVSSSGTRISGGARTEVRGVTTPLPYHIHIISISYPYHIHIISISYPYHIHIISISYPYHI